MSVGMPWGGSGKGAEVARSGMEFFTMFGGCTTLWTHKNVHEISGFSEASKSARCVPAVQILPQSSAVYVTVYLVLLLCS